MSAFIKAAATGLVQEPAVNAVIDDATNEIIFRIVFSNKVQDISWEFWSTKWVLKHDNRDFVDVSFAAATPKGLVVPVIRNVESMSILDVSFTYWSNMIDDICLGRTWIGSLGWFGSTRSSFCWRYGRRYLYHFKRRCLWITFWNSNHQSTTICNPWHAWYFWKTCRNQWKSWSKYYYRP